MPELARPSPLDAASEVASFLEENQVPYVIMGGLAVQHWGEPRATRDVDVTVLVPSEEEEHFLSLTMRRFGARIPDAKSFARKSRILLLTASNGCPIDLSLGILGYEEQVMNRAVTVTWPGRRPVSLISCEDLLIHKCVAGRPRDLEDVKCILWRQEGKVEVEYVREWLRQFATLTPHDALAQFEQTLTESRSKNSDL